jgi:transketolase
MLIYSLLHLSGYELSLDDIRNFRQWGSPTAGHPERDPELGIETTTGPLGQGVGNTVGMALAEKWLAARYNRPGHAVVDHHTYAFCSDGDIQEGISHEVAALAGHLRLGKLIWLYDDNQISIEGSTGLSSSTDEAARFEGYGWHVQRVADGNDLVALDTAIQNARMEAERPSLISVRTVIAFGSPNKAGSESTHGAPLGEDEVRATKENLGYPSLEPFYVDPAAEAAWRALTGSRGEELEQEWADRMHAYEEAFPDLAAELKGVLAGELPPGWDEEIPDLAAEGAADATRSSSGKVLKGLAARIPNLIGGSADLAPSNKTDTIGGGELQPGSPNGRIIRFGIREHGMGGILNGMALHGGIRPFGGTFLIFSDYMRPAIRMASLMGLPVSYVFTHDSIGLGEDGPTHQPVEQVMTLRAIPNLMDMRPADPAETVVAWKMAMERSDGPTFLSLTRQKVPALDRTTPTGAEELRRGAYTLVDAGTDDPQVILIASGSEVHIAVEARETLEAEGIGTRVVSMPSWYLFQRQNQEYQDRVLPPAVTARVSVEAGTTLGWDRWTGSGGASVGIDRFGASAPAEVLYEKYGITAAGVVEAARKAVGP